MSLASRLSAFFLAALAAVLVGFSFTLYALAVEHLHHQVSARLDATLAALSASVEMKHGRVEWEPRRREFGPALLGEADRASWIVRDRQGELVDHSDNFDPERVPVPAPNCMECPIRDRDGQWWRMRAWNVADHAPNGPRPDHDSGIRDRRLHSNRDKVHHHPDQGHTHADQETGRARTVRYASLMLAAFVPLGPTRATLDRLALTLTALSISLWLLAAVTGRWLCRRALVPLTRMAAAAREAGAIEPGARLPSPRTGDELDDLGQAFNGLLDRLHEALERQRRFTGDASHQLRTPLAGLLSQVDVALRQERANEEYQRVLKVVRAKSAHLRQIIESLLFLARTESESGQPDLEIVSLDAWLADHLRGWMGHPRIDDLRVMVDGPGPFQVRAHPPLLSQLVDNLLENACKYSDPGTAIAVRLERGPGRVLLAVEDRGRGLSDADQTRVFQPFFRADDSRSRGLSGVGLGLAVAQRIATSFGGTIRAEGRRSGGSRFTITLPEAAGAVSRPGPSADAEQEKDARPERPRAVDPRAHRPLSPRVRGPSS